MLHKFFHLQNIMSLPTREYLFTTMLVQQYLRYTKCDFVQSSNDNTLCLYTNFLRFIKKIPQQISKSLGTREIFGVLIFSFVFLYLNTTPCNTYLIKHMRRILKCRIVLLTSTTQFYAGQICSNLTVAALHTYFVCKY